MSCSSDVPSLRNRAGPAEMLVESAIARMIAGHSREHPARRLLEFLVNHNTPPPYVLDKGNHIVDESTD